VPIISPSGGGGGVGKHGTGVNLNASIVSIATGITILWDNVFWSSETYYNPATGIFTIPAGRGGIYLLTGSGELSSNGGVAISGFEYKVIITGVADNFVIAGSQASNTQLIWDLAGGMIVQLAAGESFVVQIIRSGGAADLIATLSGFACVLLAQ
jgi:hypothetical protein